MGTVVAVLGLAGAVSLALLDRLPDPVASHFGPGGLPDGGTLRRGVVGVGAVVAVVGALVLAALPFWARASGAVAAAAIGLIAAMVGGIGGLFAVLLVASNLDAKHWQDAHLNGAWVLAVIVSVLVLPLVASWGAWCLVPHQRPALASVEGAAAAPDLSGMRTTPRVGTKVWFGPRRSLNWGWSPVSWEGWAVTLGILALILVGLAPGSPLLSVVSVVVGLVVLLGVVLLKGTSPGGFGDGRYEEFQRTPR